MPTTLAGWEAESVRVTLFFPQMLEDLGGGLESIFGAEVESLTVAGTAPFKQRQEIASFGPGKLLLAVTGNRADFTWQVEPSEVELTMLGGAVESLDAIVNPIASWLEKTSHKLTRVAVGGHQVKIVDSVARGYELLSDYLPFQVDNANAEDLVLQINRPLSESFRDDPMRFNRLCRWSVKRFLVTQLLLNTSGQPPVVNEKPHGFALACELDFSSPATAPEPLFNPIEAAELIRRLKSMCIPFLEHGDHASQQ